MSLKYKNLLSIEETKKDNFVNKIKELGIIVQFNSKKVPKNLSLEKYNSKKRDLHKKVHLVIYSKDNDFKNLFFEYSLEIGRTGVTYKAICMIPIKVAYSFYNNKLNKDYAKYFSLVHFDQVKNLVEDTEEGYYVGLITGDNNNLYDIQIFPSETMNIYDKDIQETAIRCLKEEMGLKDIDEVLKIKGLNHENSVVIFELI